MSICQLVCLLRAAVCILPLRRISYYTLCCGLVLTVIDVTTVPFLQTEPSLACRDASTEHRDGWYSILRFTDDWENLVSLNQRSVI